MKKFLCALMCVLLALPLTVLEASAKTFVPYLGYEYNYEEESVPAPIGYEPEAYYLGAEIGAGAFSSPTDMCFYNGELYILDSGNSRIVVTDAALNPVREIGTLTYDGAVYSGLTNTFRLGNGPVHIETEVAAGQITVSFLG